MNCIRQKSLLLALGVLLLVAAGAIGHGLAADHEDHGLTCHVCDWSTALVCALGATSTAFLLSSEPFRLQKARTRIRTRAFRPSGRSPPFAQQQNP